jgi:hypothetical protein
VIQNSLLDKEYNVDDYAPISNGRTCQIIENGECLSGGYHLYRV